jgi:dTDP-4-dehydrorhamnose reductase
VAPIAGVCHLGSDEVISKADYAERLIAYAGLKSGGRVRRVRLADRPMQASRPLDTSLRVSASVAALCPVPSLDAAIRRLAAEFITTPPVSGRRAAVNERNDP